MSPADLAVHLEVGGLLCALCLLVPDPPVKAPAITIHDGVALCEPCADNRRRIMGS